MVTPMSYHWYYFILFNNTTLLYLQIYMITHPRYDTFVFVICPFINFFMYYTYDTDAHIYVFYVIVLDHLKPYASH